MNPKQLAVMASWRRRMIAWFSAAPGVFPILALFLILGTTLSGQETNQTDGRDLRKLTGNTVYRDRIQAHWLPDNTRLWYEVKTGADTHEFILVDAVKGERKRAFDHERLARALTEAGVKDARPDQLPIDKLEFKTGENRVQFRAGGKSWSYDLETCAIHEQKAGQAESSSLAPANDSIQASLTTGEETRLTFINRTEGDVELFWLNLEGERQSYGRIKAGEQRDQHTFAGHAWLVADYSGKTLAVYVAEEEPSTVEIGLQSVGRPVAIKEAQDKRPGRDNMPPRDTSPDGHWRAFIKDHNVLLKNLENGEEAALSSDGNPDDAYMEEMHWSPDSTKLVVIRAKKGEDRKVGIVESSPRDQLQPKVHFFAYAKPGDRIPIDKPQLFDVPGKRQIPVSDELFPNPWSISDLRWEADSSRFTFLYNQRGHQVLRIVAVDAKTGEARPIVDEQSKTFICYSSKYFAEHIDKSGEIVWMSERDGWNHLYLYDAHSGKVKNQITRGEWVVRHVEKVENRQIWFTAGGIHPGQDPYYIHYCRVNFDGTGLTVLTEGDGNHSIQYSPDRRYFIDTYSRVDLPPVNELRRTEDGKLVCELERADWSALLKTGWSAPERFVAKGRDGETDIYGTITRPMNFDPNKKYPILEEIYAGPQDSFVSKRFSAPGRHQELANLGFVVVQMDGMGTSNRSKKFHDVCWKNLADAGFPDRILWIKAAASKYPYMDLSRVGLFGTSAGGQSALGGLLTHPDFYKAAVADCGCHDNRMDKIWWNEQWMGWPVGPHYEAQSNVTMAHQLQGKLLLMVGELDKNVDPASTMQVVNALIKANKDFEFLVVPGAGHGVAASPYGGHRLREFFTRQFLK
jgi:dipeptidyl-peptidase 4